MAAGLVGAVLSLPALGCGDAYTYVYFPEDAGPESGSDAGEGGGGGSGGEDDPGDAGADDAGEDADAGPSCAGECVPLKPKDFSFPLLLWVGLEQEAPPCPAAAPVKLYTGHTELVVPEWKCPSCACGPSSGSCLFSSTFTAHVALCNVEGAATSFDAPPGWNGSCNADNAVPAGQECPAGSGIPCVQSVTMGALEKAEEFCTPEESAPVPKPVATWNSFALACEGVTDGVYEGCDAAHLCVPKAQDRFRQCVYLAGEHDCPLEGYTERHVFFDGAVDGRLCTQCECSPPEGSLCTATVSLYKDDACTVPLMSGVPVSSEQPVCHELTPKGEPLGSKTAGQTTYHPGVCQAKGGELVGTVEPQGATTFCCLE
jgi:hypothetical protein